MQFLPTARKVKTLTKPPAAVVAQIVPAQAAAAMKTVAAVIRTGLVFVMTIVARNAVPTILKSQKTVRPVNAAGHTACAKTAVATPTVAVVTRVDHAFAMKTVAQRAVPPNKQPV